MTPAVGDNMKNSQTDQNDCNRGAGLLTGRPGRSLAGLLCVVLGVGSVLVESTSCSADEVRKGRGRKDATTAVAEKKPAAGEKSATGEQSADAVKPGSLGELIDQQIRQGWRTMRLSRRM